MVPGSNIVSVAVGCLFCIYEYMFFDCLQNVLIRIGSTAETSFGIQNNLRFDLFVYIAACYMIGLGTYTIKKSTRAEYAQHVRRWLRVR